MISFWWKENSHNIEYNNIIFSKVSLGNYRYTYSSIEVQKLNFASIHENINVIFTLVYLEFVTDNFKNTFQNVGLIFRFFTLFILSLITLVYLFYLFKFFSLIVLMGEILDKPYFFIHPGFMLNLIIIIIIIIYIYIYIYITFPSAFTSVSDLIKSINISSVNITLHKCILNN